MQTYSPIITKALQQLEISDLNDIQKATLLANENDQDIVLLAPTGSGKTLAFLLPILLALSPEVKGIQALILVPSRELALQIEQVFRKMGTGYKVNCSYGGHSLKTEKNNFIHPPAVLIGTPGRIADHIAQQNFDTSDIQILVLDEFDKALEFGFEKDMSSIMYALNGLKKRILTSATKMKKIPEFTGVEDPMVVNFLQKSKPEGLSLKAVRSLGNDKLEALFQLVCKLNFPESKATLVFCNHRAAVERISELLWEKGLVHGIFHGGLEQDERERNLIKFRNGSHNLLITTDLASRGLDIPDIEHIIHYQLPQKEEAYIHRNGRTARMHAVGNSYLVLSAGEKVPPYIKEKLEMEELEDSFDLPKSPEWVTIYLSAGKKEKVSKFDVVGLFYKKGKLKKDELGMIEVLDHAVYVAIKKDKTAVVLRQLKGEKLKKTKPKIEVAK
ncbi:DEAD/DEAH box helicase [Flexithrix dorotheae]|uniref:DEAD/DEAH box helicase n=1 Tax=Flexithrix dorotheae TaxID=70993 RepID=UPI0003638E2C|nr:DEAD/DEAH box helicase [Flexithrix dorotheae]